MQNLIFLFFSAAWLLEQWYTFRSTNADTDKNTSDRDC